MFEIIEDYVIMGAVAPDAEAIISDLAARLHTHGAVDAGYGDATIAREKGHPTGLPTRPFPIAIPHADAVGVNRSALAVACMAEPVVFLNMGDPDEELAVEIVLLLANNSPEEQVRALQNLATVFGEPEKLAELRGLSTPAQIVAWLKREITPV